MADVEKEALEGENIDTNRRESLFNIMKKSSVTNKTSKYCWTPKSDMIEVDMTACVLICI